MYSYVFKCEALEVPHNKTFPVRKTGILTLSVCHDGESAVLKEMKVVTVIGNG